MWSSLSNSTSFRLSLLAVPLYVLAGWALLAFVYFNTLSIMEGRVDNALKAEHKRISEDLRRQSRRELVEAFQERMAAERGSTRLYLLEDEDGDVLVANFSLAQGALPQLSQFSDALARREPAGDLAKARLYAFELPKKLRLIIGRDLAEEEPFRKVVEESLAFAVPLTVFLAFVVGALTSRAIVRRLSGFNASSRRILHGDLSERLPISRSSDEFDHLAENLNEALERIGELMRAAREVSNNIAHDLRSPLSRVRNRLELALISHVGKEEIQESLAASLEEIDGLLDTFEALLSIARLDHGLAPELHPVELARLIGDVADYYAPLAEEKGLTLETDIDGPTNVSADRHLLFQAFSNLVDNALRYAPQGGRILLFLRRAGDEAVAGVADNGPGVPPEKFDEVLKRFVRLDSSRNQPGNGLGLSVVRAVAQHHHAKLTLCDNRPGLRVALSFSLSSDANLGRT